MKAILLPAVFLLWGLTPGGAQAPCKTNSTDSLNLQQARAYMVTLINRDRQSQGRAPVTLDLVASGAAQGHTDEMVEFGYSSHWGLDGKMPVERYTEGGGADADAENEDDSSGTSDCSNTALTGSQAQSTTGASTLPLVADPRFSRATIEGIESDLFNEQPPDGHRENILRPNHNHVGIAISLAAEGRSWRLACTQEFVDQYGTYAPLPAEVNPGDGFDLQGKLAKGLSVQSVLVRYDDLPKPMTVDQLNQTGGYTVPQDTIANYFLGDDAAPVTTSNAPDGQQFAAHIATPASWKPGLYYIDVWANKDGSKDPMLVSQRTMLIGNANYTQWSPWLVAKDAKGKETSLNSRKGCGPVGQSGSTRAWTVQLRNDDPASAYRIVYELFAANKNSPANWPAGATTITLPAGQIFTAQPDATIPNSQGCTVQPHLFYSVAPAS